MESIQQNGVASEQQPQEEGVNLRDLFDKCLHRWWWFAASIVVCVAVGVFYILRSQPTWTRSATIVIKADQRRTAASSTDVIAELGGFRSSSKTANEVKAFQAVSIMQDVVRRLHLDMNYSYDGRFHPVALYGSSLPFNVSASGIKDGAAFDFDLDISGAPDSLRIFNVVTYDQGKKTKHKGYCVTVAMGDTIETVAGRICVTPSLSFDMENEIPYAVMHVARRGIQATTMGCSRRLSVTLEDKLADVIRISFTDRNISRAEDVINSVIAVYNERWIEDKNQVTISTSLFINDRLEVIEKELSGVEESISEYKSQNLLPDVEATTRIELTNASELNAQIQALNSQLYMTRHISHYLSSSSNKWQMIPANSGIENPDISAQIAKYNETLINYNTIVSNSSATNPIAQDLDSQLTNMREAIMRSLDNHVLAIETQIGILKEDLKRTDKRIAQSPTQAKFLLSEQRQQSVKEAIYLYLLEKREENELSQAFTAYNTRILDTPVGSNVPVSPKSKQILLLAFLVGLMIPLAAIYLMEMFNTKLRGRADLKGVTIPLFGELPLDTSGAKEKEASFKTHQRTHKVVVEHGNRNAVNEAFRVLRTNLEFATKDKEKNVFMFTSFNPSSGKSFVAVNTAVAFAIKGQRVLVVDGDLRNASCSALVGSPAVGLSTYLGGHTDDIDGIICKNALGLSMDVVPVGVIPPNPSELISDPRFAALLEHVRPMYDYVFVDCPPVDIVSDAQIVGKYMDRTVFVVRVGLLERNMIPELENIYRENRFKNMCLVLNGTFTSGHYGSRYGYHYGHYGRSYGNYGYGHKSSSTKGGDAGWKVRRSRRTKARE